jgi:hypothetical protein
MTIILYLLKICCCYSTQFFVNKLKNLNQTWHEMPLVVNQEELDASTNLNSEERGAKFESGNLIRRD